MDRLIALLREKSVRRGDFTLASGRQSDLYVDARQVTLHAEGSRLIAREILDRLHPSVTAVGGLALGAVPIACSVAALSTSLATKPIHAFVIRKHIKDHGTNLGIEGTANISPGAPVAILEDTTTTGGSLLQAVERARAYGLEVVQCLTVVDREEGAAELIAGCGVPLEALTRRRDLV